MAEDLYKSIVEESNDGIFVAQEGEIVYVNDRLLDLTGYEESDLLGESKTALVTADDSDLVEEYHEARMAGEDVPNQYEVELETADSDRVPVELSVSRGELDGVPAATLFCRDITSRKERERELERVKREYEAVFENVQDALFLLDVEEDETVTFQRLNQVEEEFTGKSSAEIRGQTPAEAFGEELGRELRANYQKCIDSEETIVYEEELEVGDERTVWQTKLTPIVVDGQVEKVVGSGRDITERKEYVRNLANTRKRLRVLLNKTPGGVIIHDEDGTVLDTNRRILENLGYSEAELSSMTIADFEVGIDEDELHKQWAEMDVGETLKLEGRYERQDGTTYPVEVWVSKIVVNGQKQYVALSRDITERKERERRLRQYKQAVEASEDMITAVDENGRFVFANSTYKEYYDADDIEGESIQTVVRDETFKSTIQPQLETAMDGEGVSYERTEDVPARGERTLAIKYTPITDNGEVTGVVGTFRDITERKEYERALEDARTELRQIIDLVPDLIFVKNREGEYLLANEATAEAYGSTPEEIEGSVEREVIPDVEDSEQFREDDIEVLDSGESKVVPEEELTTADGETRILQTTKIPYETSGSGEEAVLGYGRDITELKEYERELATERDFLDSVIESLPYPFYVIDTDDYTIEYANSQATVAEGETCYERTHERDQPCDEGEDAIACPLSDVTETGEPVTVEHVHLDEEGDERIFQVHASPIFDDDGNVVQMGESNIDITDRVESQQRLEQQRDNLELLNQIVRHDIRNDLQVVTTYAETLATYVEDDGEAYLSKILEASHDAVEITETARDVTEIMLQSDSDPSPVGLRRVLEGEIEDVRSNYDQALVTVDGSIPGVRVLADDMLESVFRNLLSNGIQHNDKEVPEVTVRVTRTDGAVTVEIADNGPGIPDERKDDIFEEGEHGLDSDGTGLGLYLVETLVERYGGDIVVEDNDPEGSVFVLTLPAAE